jgi:hypothetical protein
MKRILFPLLAIALIGLSIKAYFIPIAAFACNVKYLCLVEAEPGIHDACSDQPCKDYGDPPFCVPTDALGCHTDCNGVEEACNREDPSKHTPAECAAIAAACEADISPTCDNGRECTGPQTNQTTVQTNQSGDQTIQSDVQSVQTNQTFQTIQSIQSVQSAQTVQSANQTIQTAQTNQSAQANQSDVQSVQTNQSVQGNQIGIQRLCCMNVFS